MKKILILSDTHSNFNKVLKIFENEKPDIVIAAGDGIKDIDDLYYIYNNIEYYTVRGNCDFFDRKHEEERYFEIDGVKFFLTHGHLHNVKKELETIKRVAKEKKVNVVVYGHTHKEYYEQENELVIFNPGAAEDGKYGILILSENKINLFHKQI